MYHRRLTIFACILLAGTAPVVSADDLKRADLDEVEETLRVALTAGNDNDASLGSVHARSDIRKLVEKHDIALFGGPMVGSVTPTSARIWVRTTREVEVQAIAYRSPSAATASRKKRATAERDLTAVLELEQLEPFTVYHYDVLLDGVPVFQKDLPAFRTFPRPGQQEIFSVGFGGGARYIPENERMWSTIASLRPAAFLFLGDNIYIDRPEERNYQRLLYYRRQFHPAFKELTSTTAIYSIWDDHDFGVNDCSGGLAPFDPEWKLPVWRVFAENWNNPAYGGGPEQPGCWYQFSIGDVDFFMTDGRYYRSFKDGTMLGPAQKKWLLDRLRASKAKFKVIASGTLWTEHADKGGADSWWGVKKEREEIFSLIDTHPIEGVILISADRHRTDVYEIARPGGYTLYEFETSKLTNTHTHGTKPQAIFSYNKGNFFGLLTFDFRRADPTVSFRLVTIDGEAVYEIEIERSRLTKPSPGESRGGVRTKRRI